MKTYLPLCLFVATVACTPAERGPSVLIVTLDTVRADALGCYGGRTGITPNLDRLAREGVRFANARTVAPLTLPAHASMMTGLYPLRHSVRDNGFTPLPDEALTLAELARDQGYETAAFIAASVLDRGFGLAQGFARFDQPTQRAETSVTAHYPERKANEIVAAASAWIERRDRTRPFMLWVHFFDPHNPYEPPADLLQLAAGNPYLGEVAYVDRAIGELRGVLERNEAWADTLVVVVGDHGEGLGEHGEPSHGALCFDSTLRVPFIVRHPDGHGAGSVIDGAVSVVDVFPTVAAALGVDAGDVDGTSVFRGDVPDDRGVYFETYYGYLQYGWSPIAGWADGSGKYVHGTVPQFFDTATDPGERNDLGASASRADEYRAAIAQVAGRPRLRPTGGVDAELLSGLEDLGYATSGSGGSRELPDPLDATGRPDARDRAAEVARLYEALDHGEHGRFEDAIRSMRAVIAENPYNNVAQDWTATWLIHLGRCEEAVPLLRALLARGIDAGSTHNSLGHCLLESGDAAAALPHFEAAFRLEPTNPILPHNIALALERLGRGDEARSYRAMGGGR